MKPKNPMGAAAAALVIASCLLCCSSQGDRVVARVNGAKITADDLRSEMKIESTIYDRDILTTQANLEAFRRRALDRLIQEEVMLVRAEGLGIRPPKDIPETRGVEAKALKKRGIEPGRWREAQKRRSVIRELIEKEVVAQIPVEESAVSSYYAKNAQEFRSGVSYHAQQILVDTRELADEIRGKIAKGEEFAGLAKKHSQSPDGARGGDLGYFDAAAYPEVFAETCSTLKPGEVSGVIASPYGFQIFKLIDTRPARHRSLEEASESIRRLMREQRAPEFYVPWIENLMAGAAVEVDEEALKEVRLEG
ncbi:MAG: peptidyl-prolyl cis-trans isomerase [Proteobacteria bacterium]|nr:peptidyl-prolyl cis-trans isomerase [Pseudomonadota bacterium]